MKGDSIMENEQMDIFTSSVLKTLKIDKPIRLIELFAGYGSQALALQYLGANFESYRICEWNYRSFEAYYHLHCSDDRTDYSEGKSDDFLREWIFGKGVSADWNEPMNKRQIARLSHSELKEIYNCAIATHNEVDVSRVNAKTLDIERERERSHCYIMTYSFPCQDLSLAGKCKGMEEGSGTRSSLLWQVERILGDLRKESQRPDILLMENVPQVHGKRNEQNFNRWLNDLHDLGYTSYFKDLEATGFGIPQTRNRCFVVSMLGEKSYEFPKEISLTRTLKDMLEENADEKYCISEKMFKYISETGTKTFHNSDSMINMDIARTLTTENDKRAGTTNYICKQLPENQDLADISTDAVSIPIKDNTAKGYRIAHRGDGIDISSRMDKHRGTVVFNGKELYIRKLTPREYWRLMGVRDDDFDKVKDSFTDAVLYHLAGDSIVVNVLMAIFYKMI